MADTASLTRPSDEADRKRFTWSDVEAMIRAGVIDEGGAEQLIDGEIWVMPAEVSAHVDLKVALNRALVRAAPDHVAVACDSTLRLSEDHAPSPDFYVFPAAMKPSAARGPDILLVIEIAESSVKKDLAVKGPKYREYGVREYWVVDLTARMTHVHLLDAGWPERSVSFDTPLTPGALPELALRLADYEA